MSLLLLLFAGGGAAQPSQPSGGGLRKTVWRPHFVPRPISDPAKTYAYTGTGGLRLGGAATTRLVSVRIYAYEASGGLRITGRAATVLHPIEDEEFLILGL